jgi:hypothetical protein
MDSVEWVAAEKNVCVIVGASDTYASAHMRAELGLPVILVGLQTGLDAWYNWALPVRDDYNDVHHAVQVSQSKCSAHMACS